MYYAMIVLLMGVVPAASVLVEWLVLRSNPDPVFLIGKWFVF